MKKGGRSENSDLSSVIEEIGHDGEKDNHLVMSSLSLTEMA